MMKEAFLTRKCATQMEESLKYWTMLFAELIGIVLKALKLRIIILMGLDGQKEAFTKDYWIRFVINLIPSGEVVIHQNMA